jgi:hypothetical protein
MPATGNQALIRVADDRVAGLGLSIAVQVGGYRMAGYTLR